MVDPENDVTSVLCGIAHLQLSLNIIFADGEIDENSVIRKFRITAADGKTYNTNHYNLSTIIAVPTAAKSTWG